MKYDNICRLNFVTNMPIMMNLMSPLYMSYCWRNILLLITQIESFLKEPSHEIEMNLKRLSHEIESILKELSYEIAMSMHDGTV